MYSSTGDDAIRNSTCRTANMAADRQNSARRENRRRIRGNSDMAGSSMAADSARMTPIRLSPAPALAAMCTI